ncbi:MAG TPA: cation diffusion facilitator family transporter [Actinophytocola sp.]|uniref:cation diffusion facilitator family transporter n=1 Tax=Actinophytocola sp. TaxID=1872138 RepID=UPI002DBB3912|nr:cation diffusion facilitator family transporter [Actinophytocola sp.]HEU5473482.1 cation diffusion facilitator family transporter [Actinophytocola sp.]
MGHGHGHGHGPPVSAGGRYVRPLTAAFVIAAVFMVVEIAVGLATSSLALISDGAHMLTDTVGIGLALAAIVFANRGADRPNRTFGLYRAEVLAALANAVLLFGVAGYVIIEAATRLSDPPEVPGLPVLIAATLGLGANVCSFLLLRKGSTESLNIRGAYLEVIADLIGSIGVLLSGAVTLLFGWRYADPLIGVAIGLFVLPRTWTLARRSLRILFQHAPERVDVDELSRTLAELAGVTEVHDLHVWTLTSGMEVASAHLTVCPGADQDTVLRSAQDLLATRYRIEHATLQLESGDSPSSCHELSW